MNKIFLIAEIGINHNGSLELAKRLIDQAVEEKWDAVKFQKRNVEKVIPKDKWYTKHEDRNGNIVDYIEYKKSLELSRKDYDEIDRYTKERGIKWFASAWDIDSLKFLDKYDLPFNKIASAMLTNSEFLKEVAKRKKLTFISTGMSEISDIDNAVEIFRKHNCPFILMHCTGIYPCPPDKINLRVINMLRQRYNVEIGYSSHHPGILDAPLAVMLGTKYIEKHITLDRSMWGSDQSASIERPGMRYIRRNVDIVETMLGSGKKELYKKEQEIAHKLRYWEW